MSYPWGLHFTQDLCSSFANFLMSLNIFAHSEALAFQQDSYHKLLQVPKDWGHPHL